MSLTVPSNSVEVLPNEILTHALIGFSVKELLPVARTSHRFHSIVTQILHRRLFELASLPDHDLQLECYPPIARLSTPTFACHYLGIEKVIDGSVDAGPSLSILDREQYVSFRPAVAENDWRTRRRRRIPEENDDTATEDLHVDADDLFSQLCVKIHVVKPGPKLGVLLCQVQVFDGVIRIWRNRLREMSDPSITTGQTKDPKGTLLWAGTNPGVGIRFQVAPVATERRPVISRPNDLPPLFFNMIYTELLVPAGELLLAMDRAAIQEISHAGQPFGIDFM